LNIDKILLNTKKVQEEEQVVEFKNIETPQTPKLGEKKRKVS